MSQSSLLEKNLQESELMLGTAMWNLWDQGSTWAWILDKLLRLVTVSTPDLQVLIVYTIFNSL